MKAFVTGAAGFLGRALLEALPDATGIDLVPGPRIVQGRVEDLKQIDADVVFHTAARAQLGGTRQQFHEANVEGTRAVIRACGKARLVYTSSASVVFEGRDILGGDESAPYAGRPLNHYCATKAQAERLVLEAGGIALRPHLIWGPGEKKLLPVLRKLPWIPVVGGGRNVIDTTHVANAVHAHLLAARSQASGAFLITDGEPVRMWDWIRELCPTRGRVPYRLVWAAGWLCERLWPGEEPPVSRYLAAQLVTSHTSSIARARQELGYAPVISRREGMDELLRR